MKYGESADQSLQTAARVSKAQTQSYRIWINGMDILTAKRITRSLDPSFA